MSFDSAIAVPLTSDDPSVRPNDPEPGPRAVSPIRIQTPSVAAIYMAFDLLYRDGRDLSVRPLRDCRALLEDLVAGSESVLPVRRLAPDGVEVWRQVVERGYEGYVAKDASSVYAGGATERSLKVKMPGWTVVEDRWHRRINITERRRQ